MWNDFNCFRFNEFVVCIMKCEVLVVTGNGESKGMDSREVVTLDPEHGTLAASMEMTHGRHLIVD